MATGADTTVTPPSGYQIENQPPPAAAAPSSPSPSSAAPPSGYQIETQSPAHDPASPEEHSFVHDFLHPTTEPGQDEHSSDLPLTSAGNATLAGFNSIANETLSAVKSAAEFLKPVAQTKGESEAEMLAGPGGLLAHRLVAGLKNMGVSMKPHEIADAIHTINAAPDPMGTYLKIFQKTAAQGAGQALTAIATEGAARGSSAAAETAENAKAAAAPFFERAAEAVKGTAKDIVQGEKVAQAPAKAALRTAAGSGGKEPLFNEILTKRVDTMRSAMHDLYEQAGSSQEVAAKPLVEKLKALDAEMEKIDAASGDNMEQSLEGARLERQRAGIVKQIEAITSDPKALQQANEAYKTYKAGENINRKVIRNPSIVTQGEASGSPAVVDVDRAINQLERLKNTRYGNQLDAWFGADGTKQLMDELYRAQRMGVHALKTQKIAKWLAVAGGVGAAHKLVSDVIE